MDNVNISIIIPYRNTYDLLVRLLDSIGHKDDVEVLVIDDQSDNKCKEFENLKNIEKFKNVRFFRNESDKRSAGTCRNIGLDNARGKWLIFSDADDFFVDNYYEIVRKYIYSDYDAIFFTPTSLDLDTNELADRHLYFKNGIEAYNKDRSINTEFKIRYKFYVPWSKMIRKSFVDEYKIRFDEVFVKNDSLFSVKVGHYMKKFYTSEEVIYCSTWHSQGNLTKRKDELFVRDGTLSRCHLIKFLEENLDDQMKDLVKINKIAPYHLTDLARSGIDKDLIKMSKRIFKEKGISTFDLKESLGRILKTYK